MRPHRIDCDLFRPGKKIRGSVLYVGRMSSEKQVGLIVQATNMVPGIEVVLVGGGPELCPVGGVYPGEGKGILSRYPYLPRIKVAALMGRSDMFVLPSKYEQASKVLLEAMACGCLVIATAEASRGVIVDGRTGYLCLPIANSLATAIRLVMADPLAETVRKAAREYVLRCHSA